MLIERMTNSWLRWRVTGMLPEPAFLYVIAKYNGMSYNKGYMLKDIVSEHPEVLAYISDKKLQSAFNDLWEGSTSRGEIVSYVEMDWVYTYVRDEPVRKEIEAMIFQSLLSASDHWDLGRRNYNWSISQEAQKAVARKLIASSRIGSKRKLQIAEEFNLPAESEIREYLATLLWNRHLDKALEIIERCPNADEVVFEILVRNVNAGYVQDAINICTRFLPEREDVMAELRRIQEALNS